MIKSSFLKKFCALSCSMSMLLLLTSCTNSKEESSVNADTTSSTQTSADNSVEESSGTEISDKAIVGEWENEDSGNIYTFNADGSGGYDIGGATMPFVFDTDNGKLSMFYEEYDERVVLDYTIDDSILIIKDSSGKSSLFNKKK